MAEVHMQRRRAGAGLAQLEHTVTVMQEPGLPQDRPHVTGAHRLWAFVLPAFVLLARQAT